MRLDPEVSRAKFDQEVQKLRGRSIMLRSWCCFEREITFPNVDLVFVPSRSALVMIPTAVQLGPAGSSGIQLQATEVSWLTTRAFGVRVAMSDFDLRPPSVEFRDAWTWELVSDAGMVTRGFRPLPGGDIQNITPPGLHPRTERPFLCAQGVREYHEHPEHSGDDWMRHRGSIGLVEIVTLIHDSCVSNCRANLVLGAQLRLGMGPFAPPQLAQVGNGSP